MNINTYAVEVTQLRMAVIENGAYAAAVIAFMAFMSALTIVSAGSEGRMATVKRL